MSHNDFLYLFSISTVAYGINFSFHFSSTTIQKSFRKLAFGIRLLFICISYLVIHMYLFRFHWNLNSISAHSYVKISLLKAYLSIHKFDIVCLSETYLDTSVPLHDVNLEIQGYELVQSDHPPPHKRGGVNIHYLQESINFELQVGSKICKLVSLY